METLAKQVRVSEFRNCHSSDRSSTYGTLRLRLPLLPHRPSFLLALTGRRRYFQFTDMPHEQPFLPRHLVVIASSQASQLLLASADSLTHKFLGIYAATSHLYRLPLGLSILVPPSPSSPSGKATQDNLPLGTSIDVSLSISAMPHLVVSTSSSLRLGLCLCLLRPHPTVPVDSSQKLCAVALPDTQYMTWELRCLELV